MLYKDIYSILKINGSLTRPFSVSRGIRQGCGLSGLLYAISIEPLLVMLSTVAAPGISQAPTVSLTAYADDVTVFLQSQEDVQVLSQALQTYQRAASAKVNWEKCSSLLIGDWQDSTPPVLPQRCAWNLEGFKFLGVYLGTVGYMSKNWEGMEEKITGRLQRWRWILPQLSYRGRVLVVNNLAASMLWHKAFVLDPPVSLLCSLQKAFVNFFWDGYHWLAPGVLCLPVAEGGQGLIHLASKVASMRLQTAQCLLYAPDSVLWVSFARSVLHGIGAFSLDRHFFLMANIQWIQGFHLPFFFKSVLEA